MTVTFVATSNNVQVTKATDEGVSVEDSIRQSRAFESIFGPVEDEDDIERFLNHGSRSDVAPKGIIIQSSKGSTTEVHPAASGLVTAVATAYNKHHDLVLRPDDVWQAILTQFSFYVQAHAEELRDRLVDFQGKKTLVVETGGSLFTVDHGKLATRMVNEISKNLKDQSVTDWLLPHFSTTTENDRVVASVSVMGTLQAYFEYVFCLMCGIPHVTLLGTIDDWRCLRRKIDRLLEFDLDAKNMQSWHALLVPILDEMVHSAEGAPRLEFWDTICSNEGGGSGPRYLSGWIAAFACFKKDGTWQGDLRELEDDCFMPKESVEAKQESKWPLIDTNDLPAGIVSAPVLVDDNGIQYDTHMFAGQFAYEMIKDGTAVVSRNDWCIAYDGKKKANPRDYKHGEINL